MEINQKLDVILSPAFQEYLLQHENADVSRLLLGKVPDRIDVKAAVDQILSRRKAKDKLPSWYTTEGLIFPPPLSIEQSSSAHAATYKTSIISGKKLVDLTGGMGVDLLTLNDHFEEVTHVEIDPWLSAIFAHNASRLTEKPVRTINQSAEQFLEDYTGKATFFIDPARRDAAKNKVFLFEDCSPNVFELLPQFREKANKVLIKAAPMIDISLGLKQLENVSEVHVVSLENECKEVLFLMDFERTTEEAQVICINLKTESLERFDFTQSEEHGCEVSFSEPLKFLYEPNASIRKAGAFKTIAAKYDLKKIAPNTHLYTSEDLVADFPGRVFEIANEINKKNIKKLLPDGKANVISKNHPQTPEQIKKKFGLKDGGDNFLIGFRDAKDKSVLILASRLL